MRARSGPAHVYEKSSEGTDDLFTRYKSRVLFSKLLICWSQVRPVVFFRNDKAHVVIFERRISSQRNSISRMLNLCDKQVDTDTTLPSPAARQL